MVKKIFSLVLAIVLVTITAMCASAISQEDITITTNVYNIEVKVKTAENGVMTAQLVNNQNNVIYGIDSDRSPVVEEGKNVYTLNFRMQNNVSTGTYKVTLGIADSVYEKSFAYSSLGDVISFFENLDTKTHDQIENYLNTNSVNCPVSLTEYNDIDSSSVKTLVNQAIEALDLNAGILPTDSDADKVSKISVVSTNFTTTFASLMETAKVADASRDDFETIIAQAFLKESEPKFDSKYYATETAGETALNVADVYDAYIAEGASVSTLDYAEYTKAFDRATLLHIGKTQDYGSLKTAFLYYKDKGVIAPDMTNIQMLINNNNDADLWKNLILSNNTSCGVLVSNAENIARDMCSNSGNTGSIGGGNAGGGGGSSADKPVVPNIGPAADKQDDEQNLSNVEYTDLSQAEWAREAITYLTRKNIVNGKGNGIFSPNDNMTREECVKIVIVGLKLLDENATCDFADVSKERWSYSYIASANRLGIVTGDGENFSPAECITRQDLAVIIYRACEFFNIPSADNKILFDDEKDISSYAKQAVSYLSSVGIINGMGDGTFAPKEAVTRAQASKAIYELLTVIGGKQ